MKAFVRDVFSLIGEVLGGRDTWVVISAVSVMVSGLLSIIALTWFVASYLVQLNPAL